ncbi:MAG: hypothetical protein J5666_02635 [Bacilli bacterium]|nr:hypothetical protein [Bacilli bacterium]
MLIEYIPLIINIVFSCLLIFLVVFKKVNYDKFCTIEFLGIVLVGISYVICKTWLAKYNLIWETIMNGGLLVLVIYSIYDLYELQGAKMTIFERCNQMVANAPFDAYYISDAQDMIQDFSDSFKELVNLEDEEIYQTNGCKTILNRLHITHINDVEMSSNLSVRLNVDYNAIYEMKSTYYAKLTYLNGEEEVDLNMIVEPIFYHNKFLGRNVYFAKNNSKVLNKLQDTLSNTLQTIDNDRAQVYAMMSMIEGVIMYYDYNTKTYVVTEQAATFFGLSQREYPLSEYVNLVHPDDFRHFEEQTSVISSIDVTTIKYRLKLGSKYYLIDENAMYLNRDANLISIVTLAKTETEAAPVKEIVAEAAPKKEIDYKETLAKTAEMLEKLLDE